MRKSIGLLAFLAIWGVQVCFAQTYETSGTGQILTTVSTANPEPGHGAATGSMQLQQAPAQQTTITGTVTDTEGEPLVGVTVRLKSQPGLGVSTNVYGEFSIPVANADETLIFSFIGMENREVKLQPNVTNYKVTMAYSTTDLESVVVEAGIIQRDKLGFTGSFKTVTGEELKSIGTTNVLQSLRSLDPSFVIGENNLMGSDPNTMANITLRGGSTMVISSTFDDVSVNPNQPLFILDGFETTLQYVNDMDINRIESITILKDAASTAIFGSQGGNGVIVIETVKPKPGEVRVNYNGTLNLSAADLSVYNLMNAEEKLRFEVLAERYRNVGFWATNGDNIADYFRRLAKVQAGVDTYWLKVPIRTGVSHTHSLDINGGDQTGFLYQIGVQYKNTQGVMKGSDRETFGGNAMLQYRKDKLNIRNDLSVSVTNTFDGSWTTGNSFQKFAEANPYYTTHDEEGNIPMNLDSYQSQPGYPKAEAWNPYYNAVVANFSKEESKNFLVTNNTNLDYFILPNLRWTNSLQLSFTQVENMTFKDPRHSDYRSSNHTQQGEYTSNNSNVWNYSANTRLTYTLSLQEMHNFTLNGRANITSTQSKGSGWAVSGFPKGIDANPSYAYDYKEGSRPSYSKGSSREVNFLFAFNYNYLYRYLLDFTLSHDGTTAFGRNNKFQTNWSVGAGWNIDREPFAENWEWMQALKLRGSYGQNGNQDVTNISANVYSYYSGSDIFGAAAYLSQYANPNLKWQTVKKSSAGIDITFLNNRLNATFDVYQTKTDPMVHNITQKPSSGVNTYPVNLGHITRKGLEFSASYQIIKNIPKGIVLTARINGRTSKGTYGGFQNALDDLNKAYQSEIGDSEYLNNMKLNSLVQYRDGGSPDDLWAVRSLGIDPATGDELYLDKNGTPTFTYNADDRVVIANRQADIEGIFGFTLRYKALTANFNFSYSYGGYNVNQALFNKVENVSSENVVFNQDRRALYDRWQKAGDVAQFRAIQGVRYATRWINTPLSSRFIQRNNYIAGDNARIAWDFNQNPWIKSAGLETLTVSVSYTDLFHISTMKRERGIDYPFARSVFFGVSAQF